MSGYDELVERLVDLRPYETGSIHMHGKSQWTVCDITGHIEFYSSREAAEAACRRANIRAVLAEVERTLRDEAHRIVAETFRDADNSENVAAFLKLLDASPLTPRVALAQAAPGGK